MTTELDKLIDAVMWALNSRLPQPCRKTRECRITGGCPECFAPLLAESKRRRDFARQAFEDWRNREEDLIHFGTPIPKPN